MLSIAVWIQCYSLVDPQETPSEEDVHLWRLSWTHHPPQGVVQLPGLGQLPVSSDGRVDSAEVGQRGSEGEAVQHLQAPKAAEG